MRGRKPIPTALKILRGNPGKKKLNTDEPQPDPAIPDCPEILVGEGLKEWNRITTELSAAGLLCRLDRASIVGYCITWARWQDAEAKVGEMGVIVKSPNGFPQVNPFLSVACKAMEQCTKLALEFGCTPSSRSRVSMIRPETGETLMTRDRNASKSRFFKGGEPDEFEQFLQRRNTREDTDANQSKEKTA